MAVTGLCLCGFLAGHFLGNTPLLFGHKDAFNNYAYFLQTGFLTGHKSIIWAVELGLLGIFMLHMFLAFSTKIENNAARPIGYAVNVQKGKKGLGTFTMIWTGIIIGLFMVMHIVTLKYGDVLVGMNIGQTYAVSTNVNGATPIMGVAEPVRDLYETCLQWFGYEWYSAIYVLAMTALGFHVSHGTSSAFQTLGLNHPRYNAFVGFAGTF